MFGWLKSLFAGGISISVSIDVADTFPNPDELAKRNAIMDELQGRGIGKFVGAGGGFGQMDFQYEVADPAAARTLITEVVEKHLPGSSFSIREG